MVKNFQPSRGHYRGSPIFHACRIDAIFKSLQGADCQHDDVSRRSVVTPKYRKSFVFTLILFVTRFEAPIALEMGMHYATIAMVTDYD